MGSPDYLLAAEAMADDLGVRILRVEPPYGLRGCYIHSQRLIKLHPGLGALQRDWALWHELGHAAHGHTGDPARRDREEAQANAWAVRHMLDPHDVKAALVPGMTVQEIAAELGVYPAAVRTLLKLQSRALLAAVS